jgi:thiol-disulfide isomerase/thioredoxin
MLFSPAKDCYRKMKLIVCILFIVSSSFSFANSHIVFILKDSSFKSIWVNVFFSAKQMDPELYKLGKDYNLYNLTVPCDNSIKVVFTVRNYTFEYNLQCGDSVEISKRLEQMPYLEVKNRRVYESELNFYIVNFSFFKEQQNSYIKEVQSDLSIKNLTSVSLRRSMYMIDSLYSSKMISKEFYEKTRRDLPFYANNQLIKRYFSKYHTKIPSDSLLAVPLYEDSLANYPAYVDFMGTFIQLSELSNTSKGVPAPTTCFNYVISNVHGALGEELLFKFLKSIYLIKKDSFQVYFSKFKTIATDPYKISFYDDIIENETKDKAFKKMVFGKTGLLYSSLNNRAITFDDIIKRNKGKVIYVDFWASWCAPCRAEMPYSKALSDTLKNEKYVTLYISLDESYSSWDKASKELGIKPENSFLIINPKSSPLVKGLKLQEIPKYIIIDKNGHIVDKDARNPHDVELLNQLKLLVIK